MCSCGWVLGEFVWFQGCLRGGLGGGVRVVSVWIVAFCERFCAVFGGFVVGGPHEMCSREAKDERDPSVLLLEMSPRVRPRGVERSDSCSITE